MVTGGKEARAGEKKGRIDYFFANVFIARLAHTELRD